MPLKIYAENFRSFPKIDWEVPSGLTLIDGVNKGTGGSNMAGKCFAKGTTILMYDGSIKKVEEIQCGDFLIGPDSQPRCVRSLGRGREMMYRIIPTRGSSYVVNESHILALRWVSTVSSLRKKNGLYNISVKDYLRLPADQKRLLVGYRSGVDFPTNWNLKIDPYWLGLWLGGGHSESPTITTIDPEIVETCQKEAQKRNLKIISHGKSGQKVRSYTISSKEWENNSLLNDLIEYGLLGNKHVPRQYLTSCRHSRLKLLAGLLDSYGYFSAPKRSYEYVTKSSVLAKDICFLARSLGLSATANLRKKYVLYKHRKIYGDYWIIFISGNISDIPCHLRRKQASENSRKNALNVGIKIEQVGVDDYFGFEIEGNDRIFLLSDFTVVHNTTLFDAWFWGRYGWLPKWKGPKGGSADSVLRRKNGEVVGATIVRVTEQFGSDEIIIERHRPNRLKIWKNGIEQHGMDQKGLEAIIGSSEKFLVCVYLPQRRQKSFYWMSDTDRTELISVLAGLEDIERASKEAKILRDEATDAIDKTKLKIDIWEGQIKEFPSRIQDLTDKLNVVQKAYNESAALENRLDLRLDEFCYDLGDKCKNETDEKTDPIIEQIADLSFKIQAKQDAYNIEKKQLDDLPKLDPKYKAKVEDIRKQIKLSGDLINQVSLVRSKISSEAALAEDAARGICPECNQLLDEKTRNEKATRHWDKVEQLKMGISKIVLPDIESLEGELVRAEKEYEESKSEIDKAPLQIRSVLSDIQSELEKYKSEERSLQKEVQSIKNDIKRYWEGKKDEFVHQLEIASHEKHHNEKMLMSIQESLDLAQKDKIKISDHILEADKDISGWKKRQDEALDLVEIFGPKGYRAVCFDGLIDKLGDRSGQLLSIMTQGLYSTRLEQVGQDSKGNQKIILKPIIIRGGSEVPSDDLSGGGEERVALAYDVAIAEAAGEGLPLLLDEVLSGLDAVGKTEAMALLEEVSKSRPVLVIDHGTEFKALFNNVISVVYEDEESRLER